MTIPLIQSLSFYDSSSSDSVRTKRKKHHGKAKPQTKQHDPSQPLSPQEQQRELRRLQKAAIEKAMQEEALYKRSSFAQPDSLKESSWWDRITNQVKNQQWWVTGLEILATVGVVVGAGFGGAKIYEHLKVNEKLPSLGGGKDSTPTENNTPTPVDQNAPINSPSPSPVRQPKPVRTNHQWSANPEIKAAQEAIYQNVDRADNPLIAGLKGNVPAIPFVSSKTERAAKQIDDYQGTDQTAFKGLLLHLVDAMIEENRYSDCQRLIKETENDFKQVSLERVRTLALTKLKVDHWGLKSYKDKEIKGIAETLSCIPDDAKTNEDKLHIKLCNGLIAKSKPECSTPFADLITSLGTPTDPKDQLCLYYAKAANELKPPETDLTATLTTHGDPAIKEEALLLVAAMKPDKKVRDREFKTVKSALEKTTLNQKVKDLIIKRVTLLKNIMDTHKIAYA